MRRPFRRRVKRGFTPEQLEQFELLAAYSDLTDSFMRASEVFRRAGNEPKCVELIREAMKYEQMAVTIYSEYYRRQNEQR